MTQEDWFGLQEPWPLWRYMVGISQSAYSHLSIAEIEARLTDIPKAIKERLRLFACGCVHLIGRDHETLDLYEKKGYVGDDRDRQSDVAWSIKWLDEWPNQKSLSLATRANLFRDIFGNPFWRVPVITPIIPRIVSLARGIHERRAFQDCPILADALEEEGCRDVDVLLHLRGKMRTPGCHKDWCLGTDGRWKKCPRCGSEWDEEVQSRVVASAPHYRGCWVLNRIFKSGGEKHVPDYS